MDKFEIRCGDNLGYWNANPFTLRTLSVRPTVPTIVVMEAGVGLTGQDLVDSARIERVAVGTLESVAVEPRGDVLDAHGTLGPIALKKQPENLAYRDCFAFFDCETLLDALTALFDLYGAVSEGRLVAVPEPLTRILQHGPGHMLSRFLAVKSISRGKHRFGEFGRGPFAKSLRDRDQ